MTNLVQSEPVLTGLKTVVGTSTLHSPTSPIGFRAVRAQSNQNPIRVRAQSELSPSSV